ncbi:MAG: HD domain-containing protein [Thermofilaceae archaeon]|nr:HD domain-containing protein [Thermofilaceae archaeon]MCX8179879.1 HD domain-containing protein [Thermofilaceae archaeon]MDW8004436.1 HD domain-containing protein [Thermofilaceae archaeon]
MKASFKYSNDNSRYVTGDEFFERLRKIVEPYYRHVHHDKGHVERVYKLALRIASELKEPVDLDVLKAAALLHDIARSMEDEGLVDDHAVEGARVSRELLRKLQFPEEKVEKVAYCIEVHRFKNDVKPETIEAKVLQDADRLDMLGAVGLARAFARGGWANVPLHDPQVPPKERYDGHSATVVNHLYEKILRIKDTLHTEPARRIAEGRHNFIEEFLDRFLKEWEGEI